MQLWKFLLFGVTGDLSKKKIIPALSQFASSQKQNVFIDFIGYSRSQPNEEEIIRILNKHSSGDQHDLGSVTFENGSYTDSLYLAQKISELKHGERLVIYLALPPQVIKEFLEVACPFSDKEIDIIIEKPFGQNLNEAHEILDVLSKCSLGHRAHFIDHYLFKTTTRVSRHERNNFKHMCEWGIQDISISAIEDIGVQDRKGYYDANGALKDMIPHLYSLLVLFVRSYFLNDINPTISVEDVTLGQYQHYLKDLDIERSNTDSYFQVKATMRIDSDMFEAPIEAKLTLESGKKLNEKRTEIVAHFDNGGVFNWNLTPDKKIVLTNHEDQSQLELNLDRNNNQDHTNMFLDILDRNNEYFVRHIDILEGWAVYNKITKFIHENGITPIIYKDRSYPPTPIENESKPN